MEKVKMLADQIHKELECAEIYAEYHVRAKVDKDPEWSERTKIMAEDELRHADILHGRAVMEIDKLKEHYRPSPEMQDKWDTIHREYVNKTDWIRELLED